MSIPLLISEIMIDDVVSFNLYGTSTLPNITDGKVLGIISGGNLNQPAVAAATHANIFGALPLPKPPDNYTKYSYLVVQTQDNTIYEIGYPWIVRETVIRAERAVATTILRDFNTSDLVKLRRLLESNGFANPEIIVTQV